LLAFARQARLLDPAEVDRLERRAQADERAASAATRAARSLREALYGIFSAQAHGRAVPDRDLEGLNEALGEVLPNLRLDPRGASLAWGWRRDGDALTRPLWSIARAAAELLTREPSAPVRECGGTECTWLFLDHSRGRSRRWCSMASCGNREKARRHYRRTRDQAPL
jgi:predicted RNA-binding Zn ribbon-like protein